MKYILWHKSPDTDAYCAAVVYAQYLSDCGEDVQAIALGAPNSETVFVFSQTAIPLPWIKTELVAWSEIFLVDHNEAWQSIDDREQYTITWVIDHHKIADFHTPVPVYMRVDAVWCTCTILFELFKELGYTPTKEIALLMLSAIISDTLYYRSPTTTQRDRTAIESLAQIAGVADPEAYSLQMFAAKSDLGDMPIENILMLDYKEFDFSWRVVWIGVMETTSPEYALKRKQEILDAMRAKKQKAGLAHIMFCVVDILQETNTCFVVDDSDVLLIEKAFETKIVNNQWPLWKILSRKKQLVPMLEEYFSR